MECKLNGMRGESNYSRPPEGESASFAGGASVYGPLFPLEESESPDLNIVLLMLMPIFIMFT